MYHARQNKIGAKGAKLVKKLLTQLGNEVSKIGKPHYQMTANGALVWCFTERNYTGNISIESWSNYPEKPGWYAKLRTMYPKPKFIFNVCLHEELPTATPVIRVISTDALVDFLYSNYQHYHEKPVCLYGEDGEPEKNTRNLIVPEAHLVFAKALVKVYRQDRKAKRFVFVPLEDYV